MLTVCMHGDLYDSRVAYHKAGIHHLLKVQVHPARFCISLSMLSYAVCRQLPLLKPNQQQKHLRGTVVNR